MGDLSSSTDHLRRHVRRWHIIPTAYLPSRLMGRVCQHHLVNFLLRRQQLARCEDGALRHRIHHLLELNGGVLHHGASNLFISQLV